MLRSLRAVATASTTTTKAATRHPRAVVSTTTATTATIRGLAAQAGTVKFYLRDKGYGFIQPDANPDTDVFVHRNNISCTHNIPKEVADYSQRYPYLKKDERILFEIDYEQSTGLRKAFNVTWLNGSRIPPERSNFLGGVHERAKSILGIKLYKLMLSAASNPSLDDTALLQQVRHEFREAQISIQSGEEIIRRLGMNVSDFPTIKCRTGRPGKYVHESEAPPDDDLRYYGHTSTAPGRAGAAVAAGAAIILPVTDEERLEQLDIPESTLRDYSKVEFDDLPDFDKLPDDDKPNSGDDDDEYILGDPDSDDEEILNKKKLKPIDDTVWRPS